MGNLELVDYMVIDGFLDVFEGYYMGIIVENIVEKYKFICEM